MHTTKDLANLLQLLQTSRQSGDLIVEPQVQGETPWQGRFRLVNGQVTACQVRRKIDGRVLPGDNEALRWLINPQHGKLEWALKEDTPLPDTFLPLIPAENSPAGDGQRHGNTGPSFPAVQYNEISPTVQYSETRPNNYTTTDKEQKPTPFSSMQRKNSEALPQRTNQGNQTSESILSSRDHRQVFSLIDGRRTAEEIAQLLHKKPELVFRILSDLRAAGLIE